MHDWLAGSRLVDPMARKIRSLLFSTLYPSSVRPGHGIFIETRLRHLLLSGDVEARVVAPVPWFPFRHECFGTYSKMAATPRFEIYNGIEVHHPRYFLPPKVGMNLAPYTLAAGALPTIRRLIRQGFDFDLIDAHYYYPDGVAAAFIAAKLGKPLLITARGSDITLFKNFPHQRKLILHAADRASANIGVCRDLMAQLEELGGDPGKTHVIRNGVDLERFQPLDRLQCRSKLGLPGEGLVLVSVGNLVELKGHDLVIRMLEAFPDARLVIVGDGPERKTLQELAMQLNVADRVTFAGARPQTELSTYFSAADALVLASSREGLANVLLESMASGTPVVATAVNGTPEVVAERCAGRLAHERKVASLVKALQELLADYPTREETRRYAEGFGWEETTRAQVHLFRQMIDLDRVA